MTWTPLIVRTSARFAPPAAAQTSTFATSGFAVVSPTSIEKIRSPTQLPDV